MRAKPEKKREKNTNSRLKITGILIIVLCIIIVILLVIKKVYLKSSFENKNNTVQKNNFVLENSAKENIFLYFSMAQARELYPEIRSIEKQNDDVSKIIKIIDELKKGPEDSSLFRTIPENIVLNKVYISSSRIFLDFNKAGLKSIPDGPSAEINFLQSVVQSVLKNMGLIYENVQILADGKEWEGNHIYFDRSYGASDIIMQAEK